jgi:kynurenine formamidase
VRRGRAETLTPSFMREPREYDIAPAITVGGRRWRVAARGYDLSLPLRFNEAQPAFFGAARASEQPLVAGSFVGDVRQGGSCNCSVHTLVPHCNGTHTECVGHITQERLSVRELATRHLSAALLVSITPAPAAAVTEQNEPAPLPGDHVITQAALQEALGTATLTDYRALVVRTRPNDASKRSRNYDGDPPPAYFTVAAMRWIVEQGIDTLVVDLPSIDRAQDGGRLAAHRMFWGLPPGGSSVAMATRPQATITELAFIDDSIADGPYLLNLQVAPFQSDAAPSRPILLPLLPA